MLLEHRFGCLYSCLTYRVGEMNANYSPNKLDKTKNTFNSQNTFLLFHTYLLHQVTDLQTELIDFPYHTIHYSSQVSLGESLYYQKGCSLFTRVCSKK